jgi:hypothetical protein
MAENNNTLLKALGVAGLLVGLIGGSFGLSEVVGRDKDINTLKTADTVQTAINLSFEGRISGLETTGSFIKDALVRIENKIDKHMGTQ